MKSSGEIRNILRNGSLIKTAYYNFYFIRCCDETVGRAYLCEGSRLAIIIKKKVGIAVDRNREKRIVRQLFRSTAAESRIDLVVQIKQSGGEFHDKQSVFAQAMAEIDKSPLGLNPKN
ncbi:MAG: ribonuclease P protein component [Spirochaetales bacterium]|nr:ribonuclease P protein component [Spirochaetales bacterium]